MKKHTQVYLTAFYPKSHWDFIPCEICGNQAVDIHHIEPRGMGGGKTKDTKENLMALCRQHHLEYGDKSQHKEYLIKIHENFQETISR